jgi:hypothetical protein
MIGPALSGMTRGEQGAGRRGLLGAVAGLWLCWTDSHRGSSRPSPVIVSHRWSVSTSFVLAALTRRYRPWPRPPWTFGHRATRALDRHPGGRVRPERPHPGRLGHPVRGGHGAVDRWRHDAVGSDRYREGHRRHTGPCRADRGRPGSEHPGTPKSSSSATGSASGTNVHRQRRWECATSTRDRSLRPPSPQPLAPILDVPSRDHVLPLNSRTSPHGRMRIEPDDRVDLATHPVQRRRRAVASVGLPR